MANQTNHKGIKFTSKQYVKFLLAFVIVFAIIFGSIKTFNIATSKKTSLAAGPVCPSGYIFSPAVSQCKKTQNYSGYKCFSLVDYPDGAGNCFYGSLPLFDCLSNTPGQTEVFSSPSGSHFCSKTPQYFATSNCNFINNLNWTNDIYSNAYALDDISNLYQGTGNISLRNYSAMYFNDNICGSGTKICPPNFRVFLDNPGKNHNLGLYDTYNGVYKNVFLCVQVDFANGTLLGSQPILSTTKIIHGAYRGSLVERRCGGFGDTYYTNTVGGTWNGIDNGVYERTYVCSPLAYKATVPNCLSGYIVDTLNKLCVSLVPPIGFECSAGQYLVGRDQCTPCPPNSYCTGGVSAPIVPCPPNTISIPNSTSAAACVSVNMSLNMKVYLSGAFDDSKDKMNNTLAVNNKIPLNQPFNNDFFKWKDNEKLPSSNIATDIVDWILILIKDPYTDAYITGKAVVLKTDGTIVDAANATAGNSSTGVTMYGIPANGNYKVLVQHRNHLAISTNDPVLFSKGVTTNIDFTNNSNVYASNQTKVGTIGTNEVYGLIAGNASEGAIVDSADQSLVNSGIGLINVYDKRDVNLDGNINQLDVTFVQNNLKAVEKTDNKNTLANNMLPLGDGRISTLPRVGYVNACSLTFPNVGGAMADGSWIKSSGTWDTSQKISIGGNVTWSNHFYSITQSGTNRILNSNDIPDHNTGTFPVATSDPAYNFDRNPNTIAPQNLSKTIPLNPIVAPNPSCLRMGAIGVMKSGVILFNALDGDGKDAVAHEIQDSCSGHPEFTGEYHYHNLSSCISQENTTKQTRLVGYALDGFGIYEEFDSTGSRLKNSDLDECHGRKSKVNWNGQDTSIYHYVITNEYPYTISCFKGTPAL